MKTATLIPFVHAAIAAVCISISTTLSAKQLKVLMIGNSFSICVLKEMPKCAAAAGETLDLASLYIGGCSFDRHWTNVEKAGNPEFKPYTFSYSYASAKQADDAPVAKLGGKTNIPQALAADRWDIVTIQQVSAKSPFYDTYQPYADNLIAKIRELAPQAEIVIHETWSYSPYATALLKKWNMTPETMYESIKLSYGTLAARHNLRTIPTGDAVQLYRRRLPVDYGKLLSDKEIAAIKQPDIINFHGDPVGNSEWREKHQKDNGHNEVKLHLDSNHLNREGYYLQACTWLAALFGTDVTKLSYTPEWLPAKKATLMRECAAEAAEARAAGHLH